ncbi:MAG TPA: c-type cytochrome [Candidatus Sulfotelmatobacter sp.]|nr:c-type cytochrome [Candidatus Sulfotelmatobacter sp.]
MKVHVLLVVALPILLLPGCTGGRATPPYRVVTGGNARSGRKVIQSAGCGACHTIPGIHAAHGELGPPLNSFSRRTMIAGELPNTPDNLVRWIEDPPSVESGTAMPNLGLDDQQARDAAAYLYTLR